MALLERVTRAHGIRMPRIKRVHEGDDLRAGDGPFLVECAPCATSLALKGKPTAVGGEAAVQWIECATRHAMEGQVDGIVTAPISKQAIHKAGYDWPGHTELLAAKTSTRKPVMMMASDKLRVALVTTHVAMADLPRIITRRNVLDTIRITHHDLRRYFDLRRPRIAVCGLNPHAGEAGKFGKEESRAIRPAVNKARAEGIRCDGPVPGDVAFTPGCLARHDAIVAMYHDQATIPVKMTAFESGVNITLGLPIVRTSPDHGTAYDIVRKGVAHPGSMIEAILMAARMAQHRRRRT